MPTDSDDQLIDALLEWTRLLPYECQW